MVVPDLNLAMYAHVPDHPWHEKASVWWTRLLNSGEPVGIALIVRMGFVRLMSSASVLADPLRPERALQVTERWFSIGTVQEIHPAERHYEILERLLRESHVGGKLVNDAHLAALAIERRAELHTNDTDFLRFEGLRVVRPLR